MQTINDFPTYTNLSGWSTKGEFTCPYCAEFTCSKWLYKSQKYYYMGHHRWLPEDHVFRNQSEFFDGTEELRPTPIRASGSDVLKQLNGKNFTLVKQSKAKQKKRKKSSNMHIHNEEEDEELNKKVSVNQDRLKDPMKQWKKNSIFFNLPYQQYNLLRHNLDVMHIEKNVCDNLIGTLLNLDGKSKDNLKSRLDLEIWKIRIQLHAKMTDNGRKQLSPASFTMIKKEKYIFCKVLKNVKMLDGYASNISKCINQWP